MSWEFISNCDGDFIYNWVAVQQIARNFARAKSMVANAKTVEDNHLNPFVPDTASVEVDFKLVRKETDENSRQMVSVLRLRAENSATVVREELLSMMQQTRELNQKYEKMLKDAQHKTMRSIESAVGNGQVAESVFRGIRDVSAEVLILGATVSTGGAAGALIFVAGPALKGVAKYQDTGSWASAGIEFGVSLGLNKLGKVIDAKQAAGLITQGENIMLNILATKASNAKDPIQAWVEGSSITEASASATAKSTAAAGTELAKSAGVDLIKEGEMVSGYRFATKDFKLSGKAFAATAALATTAVAVDRLGAWLTSHPKPTPTPALPLPANVVLIDTIQLDSALLDEYAQRQVTSAVMPRCPQF